jgi:RNA polymerase sigma factor (sigma-70 family)
MPLASSTRIRRQGTGVSPEDQARWNERSDRLYRDLRRPAVGMVRRAFGGAFSDDEIEDIYANAWLGTLRALAPRHEELDDDEIRRYLLTAVANHASKELRRRRRKPTAPLEAAGAVSDLHGDPVDSATSSEASRVARDVLTSLPPRRRAVMLLRYGWGLEPKEVCGLVQGLSPRAYRKEIARGVDEIAKRLRLVESGEWCQEREPVLKAYAAGTADEDQRRQAEQHLSHCRHCSEFVGRLTGHLHDLGSAAALPGALTALDEGPGVLERVAGLLERLRDATLGQRPEALADAVPTAAAARGAGAAGAGVFAKLAGLGAAGKIALACVGGGAAATVCVAAGIGPLAGGDAPQRGPAERPRAARVEPVEPRPAEQLPVPVEEAEPEPKPEPEVKPKPDKAPEQPQPEPDRGPFEADTPPVTQEFDVASAPPVRPASTGAGGGAGGGSGGGAVAQEFGP